MTGFQCNQSMVSGRARAAGRDRPAHDLVGLLKSHTHGYRNSACSSRKLSGVREAMRSTVSFSLNFRIITSFCHNNDGFLNTVLEEFARCITIGMVLGFQFMDGTKVRASNSKNRNLTVSKSNNGIGRFGGHISECQRLSNERDVESDAVAANRLPRAELERWLAEVKLCLVCHEGHREWRGDGTVAAKVPTRGHYEFRKAVVLRLRPD